MKKIRLITASFGNDKKELTVRSPIMHDDYIIDQMYYNNTNTKSRINSLHPRTKGKIPKMMEWYEHPDYDYYIWIDSKFTVLDGFIDQMLEYADDEEADICFFNHPERSSTRDEMDFMIEKMKNGDTYLLSRYEGEIMEEQVNKYLADPGFKDDQLFYCGLFMYSKRLVANRQSNLMTDWFLHCILYHTQDQLWFPYLLYKHNVKYKVYTPHMLHNNFMRYNI
jgi:glycosyltransferase involved in cell wall biosynthesis